MLGEFIILPRKNDVKEFIKYIDNYPKEVAELEYKNQCIYIKANNQIKVIKIDNRYSEVISFLEGYKIGYYEFKA